MIDHLSVLSVCTTCRDGRDETYGVRGGSRFASRVVARNAEATELGIQLRGVKCMSQCKRPCIVSLSAPHRFTYIFGDIDPEVDDYVDALFALALSYRSAPEGYLKREERPALMQGNILGRLPPLASQSSLVSGIEGPNL